MPDYIIKNGWIVDGRNRPPYRGDLAVAGGRIREIAPCLEIPADFPQERVLDAGGGFVTPGFIDIHRHGDWEALRNGDDELLNRQGITTVVNGNCGLSVAPAGECFREEITAFLSSVTGEPPEKFSGKDSGAVRGLPARFRQDSGAVRGLPTASMAAYMEALSGTKRSVNTGMLAGNGTIRAGVMGYASGVPSEEEYARIHRSLEEALDAGVLGVSLGLAYAPEFEYDREGLERALAPLKGRGIPVAVHIRNEGDGLTEAIREILTVAEKLELPLHISHMKCIGKKNWGKKSREVRKLLREAGDRGMTVDYDLYPYLTGSTQLVHVLPPETQKGGAGEILRRLSDPGYRRRLTGILEKPSRHFENIVELAGFENIYASTLHSAEYAPYAGCSLEAIAREKGCSPYDALYDILIAENCQVTMLDTIASEEDMLLFLKEDMASLISDAIYPAGGKYHPRVYGAFPRLLTEYVRKRQVFSVETAVYKMTGRPAAVFGMEQGILEEGRPADINIFHLENLESPADFQHPDRFSRGFDYVLTNGEVVLEKECWTNTGSGQVVKRAERRNR